jgi:tetraacyldisaccharide 4'-kinase
MQHHRLQRDANIVLIDAKNPFGGDELLPLGDLREPVVALKRAGLVIITHSNLVSPREIEEIKDRVRLINDEIEVLEAVHKPDYLFDMVKRERVELNKFKGRDAAVFSAIGEPSSFEQTLAGLGITLKQTWRFSDHSDYSPEQMRNFAAMRGDLPLITTFKDSVKLPEGWQDIIKENLYILAVNMEIQNGELGKLMDVLYPSANGKKK